MTRTGRYPALRRVGLIPLLIGSLIMFARCLGEPKVKVRFENKGDSDLCFNFTKVIPGLCDEVRAGATTVSRPDCKNPETTTLTIVLSVAEGRREIYSRTATCKEWVASGAKITIEKRGDELVITDSLPDATPSPSF